MWKTAATERNTNLLQSIPEGVNTGMIYWQVSFGGGGIRILSGVTCSDATNKVCSESQINKYSRNYGLAHLHVTCITSGANLMT